MDLLKARERAKKKAREKEELEAAKKAGREEGTTAPTKDEPPPEAAAAAKESAEPGPEAMERPAGEEKKLEPAPLGGDESDVFVDDAFGEDLPYVESEEDESDDLMLEVTSGSASDLVIDNEDEESWEAELEQMKKETEKEPAKEAARPSARPVPPRTESAPEELEEDEIEVQAMAPAPSARVEESAPAGFPSSRGPRVQMDWEEEQDRAWSLDDMVADEDFFSIVTEELYMREFGRDSDEGQGRQIELLSFKLGKEVYAVRLTSIRQIIKLTQITMVPRAPDYVRGIISLRGNIIPILDLRGRLKLPRAMTTRKSRVVVVEQGKYTAGLIVDEVEQVVRLGETSLEPPPSMLGSVESEYIESIGRTPRKKMIIILALDKIMVPVTREKAGGRDAA